MAGAISCFTRTSIATGRGGSPIGLRAFGVAATAVVFAIAGTPGAADGLALAGTPGMTIAPPHFPHFAFRPAAASGR